MELVQKPIERYNVHRVHRFAFGSIKRDGTGAEKLLTSSALGSVASIGKIYVNKMQWAKKGSQYKSNQQTDGGKKSDNFQAWRIKQMTLAIVEIARLGDTL